MISRRVITRLAVFLAVGGVNFMLPLVQGGEYGWVWNPEAPDTFKELRLTGNAIDYCDFCDLIYLGPVKKKPNVDC